MQFHHTSVLLNESIEALQIQPDGIYVDGTLGGGGHSKEILRKLKNGHLYAFDKDITAIETATILLQEISDAFTIIHDDNCHLVKDLQEYQVEQVDGILLDLGVSSHQFDCKERGFSYRFDARLDMRMDQSQKALDAYEVINHYSYERLAKIFYEYGEEPFSKVIAKNICEERKKKPIETTLELVEIIKKSLPKAILSKKGHPAKKVFQAIRIEVNHELESLKKVIQDGLKILKPKGRMVIITFHSLEDRIVKQMFAQAIQPEKSIKGLASLKQATPQYRLVYKKPIVASKEELENNNRSHSAKLRVIEKI